MNDRTRNIMVEIAAEREQRPAEALPLALEKLAQWHEDQAKYPVNVSGSDRNIYQTARFHAEAALDIREATLNARLTFKRIAP